MGKLPFDGKNENDWRNFHLYQTLPDPITIRKDIPVRLCEIISRMTQKRIDNRYSAVQDILVDLATVDKSVKQKEAEADRLAKIAHSTVQKKTGEALKAEREQDAITEYCRMLSYHITEFLGKLKAVVNAVNESLDSRNQISVTEKEHVSNPRSQSMSISFDGKTISVTFPEWDIIAKWEEKEKKRLIEIQKNKFGMVLRGIEDSEFKKRSIIYFGKVECNFANASYQERFGYNIVLVKGETDTYGKWYVASFSDSGLSRGGRKNFALDFGEFLDNFSKAFIMSPIDIDYHDMSDGDCTRAIEEILH